MEENKMEELLKKALTELKSWRDYDREVSHPAEQRQETSELIAEIETALNGK
jgi:hypothetical protein